MAIRFASLGSGSGGNATLVMAESTCVLIDCGYSMKETQRRLARLDLSLGDVTGVLVTHEHSDHLRGVPIIARRWKMPIYMTPGTFHSRAMGDIPNLQLIHNCQSFQLGALHIQPVPVPHDACEPVQYILRAGGKALGVLTDLGSITATVIDAYRDCDALLIEANHDRQMLAMGPYPPPLKARVAGRWGHLSNEQTADCLRQLNLHRLQHLVVGHISQHNNTPVLARAAIEPICDQLDSILFACQEQGFPWLEVN